MRVEVEGDSKYRDIVMSLVTRELRSIPDVKVIDQGPFDYKVRYMLKRIENNRGDEMGIAVGEVWPWAPTSHTIGVKYAKTMKFDDPKIAAIADAAKGGADLELVYSHDSGC